MTRKALIKRLGITSGITIIAASGVLVATAAGGTSHPAHHPPTATCLTHPVSARCDDRGGYGVRHQRTIQHARHGSAYAVRNGIGHQRWGGCCDAWRNHATAGTVTRHHSRGQHHRDYGHNGDRRPGSHAGGSYHHGDRHSGSRGGRHHRGDWHRGGGGYRHQGDGHGC